MRNTILTFSLLLILLVSCRKEKFSSESNWLAPVLKTELTLGDLIPDSLSQLNADNAIDLVYEAEYGVASLEDILVIPDRIENIEVTLSSLVLDDRTFTDTLTLLELYPASILAHGTMAFLPAQDITTNEGTKIDVSEEFFSTATFIEGFIDITISNDLPVEAEIMEFELINDDADMDIIVSGVFNNLAPNTTQSKSYSLAGLTVNGKMELRVKRVKTLASPGLVLVNVYDGLRTTFGIRGLKPSVATAIFPAQNLVEREDETKYDFGGAKLTKVKVREGDILMKVESSIEEAIILDYKIPNSSNPDKTGIIERVWTIPAAAPGEIVYVEERFPIDGFEILMYGKDNTELPTYNHIYNQLIARIEYSGIERTLSLNDKIKIEFGLIDLKPELVIGDPGYHELSLQDTLPLDIFKKIGGSLNLEDAQMNIDFYNSFGIEAELTVEDIIGVNTRKPKEVKLISTDLASPIFLGKAINGTSYTNYEEHIVLDKTNSNLKQFLENMPDEIHPKLGVKIRHRGTVNQSDFAFYFSELIANLKIQVPLNIGMDSLTISSIEAIDIFKNEDIEKITAAKLFVRVDNDFPISGELELEFLDEDGNLLTKAFKGVNNIMAPAEVDGLTGKSVFPAESELVAELSKDEMVLLQNSSKVRVIARFDTKDAQRFQMFADYRIGIQISTEIVYENKL
ncbi:MAG: hypothetical protein COA58_07525 [Bacteroidetes bacterium]|nr:MAG: hypothetical protein COA58_07525 [Bacteroidota bacterium]